MVFAKPRDTNVAKREGIVWLSNLRSSIGTRQPVGTKGPECLLPPEAGIQGIGNPEAGIQRKWESRK